VPPVPHPPAVVAVVFHVTLAELMGDCTVAPALVVVRLMLLALIFPTPATRVGLLLVISLLLESFAVSATALTPPQTVTVGGVVTFALLHLSVPSMYLLDPELVTLDKREFAAPFGENVAGAPDAAVKLHESHAQSLVALKLLVVEEIGFPYKSQNHAYALTGVVVQSTALAPMGHCNSVAELVARVLDAVSVAKLGLAGLMVTVAVVG